MTDRVKILAGAVLLGLLILNYVVTPLAEDQRINLAYAQQADDFYGPFPANVIQAWTLRGIGYKCLTYFLYKFTRIFADYNDKMRFELVFKALYAALIVIILILSTWIARPGWRRLGLEGLSVLFFLGTAFFSLSYECAFQAEDVAALVMILGTALALSENKVLCGLAGAVLSLLFTLKGITWLLGLVPLLFLGLYREKFRRPLIWTGLSFGISSVALAALIWLLIPQEITDLRDASRFQSSFRGFGRSLAGEMFQRLQTIYQFYLQYFFHISFLIPGFIAGFLLSLYWFEKDLKRLAVYLSLWLVPGAVIVLQGKGFLYHFAVLLPVAAGSLIALQAAVRRYQLQSRWNGVILGFPYLLAWLCVGPVSLFPVASSVSHIQESRSDVEFYRDLCAKSELDRQPRLLYLTDGRAAYYFKSQSESRYFYPLPIKRSLANPGLRDTDLYQDEMQRILKYTGKMIVVQDAWFNLDDFPAIRDKIRNEYRPVFQGTVGRHSFTLYERASTG
ncbi:MAG: hypothetical protein ACE15F_12470 [bacterium]